MKVALVHDQLQEFGGAERVLIALKKIFPEADIFTSFYDSEKFGTYDKNFEVWRIYTSWADKVPFLKKIYSPLRFLTPLIWESFNFTKYDLVISSSGSYMSKGIITRPETMHISYIHHQPRYLYNYETGSLHELQKYTLFKIYAALINHPLRLWDYISSQRPNYLIANSEETKKRVQKFYRRESTVIYPPVDIPDTKDVNSIPHKNDNYFLTVSRLGRPKNIDVLIQAANDYKFNLKIVGTGRDKSYLESIAGPTVEFLDHVSDQELPNLFQSAKAFLFAAQDEEFGIAPIEAMGYGLPVIAYASGGVKETIKDEFNGFLFDKLNPTNLIGQIKKLESLSKEKLNEMKKNARKESEKYSFEVFKDNILEFVKKNAGTP